MYALFYWWLKEATFENGCNVRSGEHHHEQYDSEEEKEEKGQEREADMKYTDLGHERCVIKHYALRSKDETFPINNNTEKGKGFKEWDDTVEDSGIFIKRISMANPISACTILLNELKPCSKNTLSIMSDAENE